jgi:hypothetical protein
MVVTTIIPWCQRPELEQTLRHNTPCLEELGGEVIVANCGGDASQLGRILQSPDLVKARPIDIRSAWQDPSIRPCDRIRCLTRRVCP